MVDAAEIRCDGQIFRIHHSDSEDHVFRLIRESGEFYEAELLDSVRRYLRPNDLVVDVGANIGNHTLFFAGICRCRVVAIEPVGAAADLLKRNVKVNGLDDLVEVVEVALGDTSGTGSVASRTEHNLGCTTIRIDAEGNLPIRRLDDMSLDGTPRLVKVDTEGMELPILKGALRVLRAAQPVVCVEAKGVTEFSEIFRLLADLGYLVGEVHNYSPTHVFLPAVGADRDAVLESLSRFCAHFYIRSANERASLRRNLKAALLRMRKLEAAVRKLESKASAADGADRAPDSTPGSETEAAGE